MKTTRNVIKESDMGILEINHAAAAGNGSARATVEERTNKPKFFTPVTVNAEKVEEKAGTIDLTDPKNVVQRDEYINRIVVLKKVGKLLLLEGTELATAKQIAKYYETPINTVKAIYQRHRIELESDGMVLYKSEKLDELRGNVHDAHTLENAGLGKFVSHALLFTKRSILRIGMLLRDSEVARSVRDQLLNIEEAATDDQRTAAINREDELLLAMIKAKDPVSSAAAIAEYTEFQNSRIKEAEAAAAKYEEKANKFDYVTDQARLLTYGNVGKTYLNGVSAKAITQFLIDQNVLYKRVTDGVRLYKKGYEKYFKIVTYADGHRHVKATLEGALFIKDLYDKHGKEGEGNAGASDLAAGQASKLCREF
ncbi:hypothetical protein FUT12_20485 [Bacillus mycoides]|uniref:phage antirepressor KilAC domain-containing protein n=1 Tax=Bacillus mycoides TaxID=1405 RepID=UPI001879731A|nr:phage antirepressor KilAC domain-containing protein [Bacillus mycoides]MBE7149899.1 hypothetical protein [Bacillus mycoides]